MIGRIRARRLVGVLAVGALAAGLVVGGTGASATTATPTASSKGLYLALGDSVPFGYRPSAVTPPATYLNAANFQSYADYVADNQHLKLANAACPGETTSSFLDTSAQSNGCENAPGSPVGYRSAYPLHVSYKGSQLAYAERFLKQNPSTKLVTLMIGANDLFVCQETTRDKCTGTDFQQTLQTVAANVTTILRGIRTGADYHGKLVIVDYYATDYNDPVQAGGSEFLNQTENAVGSHFHALFADGYSAFQYASSPAYGGEPCAAGLLIKLPDGTCDVHPTVFGHRLLAGAVENAINS